VRCSLVANAAPQAKLDEMGRDPGIRLAAINLHLGCGASCALSDAARIANATDLRELVGFEAGAAAATSATT
jgi:hypothetical protein